MTDFVLRRVQCEECGRFRRLHEYGKPCANGVCSETAQVQPAQHKGGIWCLDFIDLKGREQRKPRRKKNAR